MILKSFKADFFRTIALTGLLLIAEGAVQRGLAQLSPPGLEESHSVAWTAVGFTQNVSKRVAVTAYVGTSRESSLANYAFWRKPAITVINQEWQYQFSPRWQVVLAGSLRFQDLYEATPPYSFEDPSERDELRWYARLYYRHSTGKVSWAHSFRPEYRMFYGDNWQRWSTPLQWRFRLKTQASIPLNEAKSYLFIVGNEWLTAINRQKEVGKPKWSPFRFTEDRLTTYIRRVFTKPAILLDLGLMHQLWRESGEPGLHYTAYLAFDVLFQQPFSRKKIRR